MEKLLGVTWLEINLDTIKKNMQNIRGFIGNQVQVMGIVKGNGYGHDAVEVSKTILECGADQLAVAKIEEGVILKKNQIEAPMLVLSVSSEEQIELYADYQIMPTICDLQMAQKFNEMAKRKGQLIKIHVKIETGMGRLGVNPEEALWVLTEIDKMENLKIEGLYTHFSTADELDKEYTFRQYFIFNKVINKVKENKLNIPFFHVANSGTILDLPEMWLNMVRPGCLVYGLYPSSETKKTIQLFPVLSFKSRISFIKKTGTEKFIGYGRTYQTKRETLVGTIPTGYADGYPRSLSNCGMVMVRGIKAPVIGRVCMDQMMIDLTDIPGVSVGDEVLLWGEQMGKRISIESVAEILNTVVDEVIHLTDKARVAKLFIKGNKPWKIKNIVGEYLINK